LRNNGPEEQKKFKIRDSELDELVTPKKEQVSPFESSNKEEEEFMKVF
jgi:hypothetical protein